MHSPQSLSPHQTRIPVLHGLRGLAALAVLLFHWLEFFPAVSQFSREHLALGKFDALFLLRFGWLGVPLFFILSGYLLGGQLLNKTFTWRFLSAFWLRRIARIYPAVWAQLACLLLAGLLLSHPPLVQSLGDGVRNALLYLYLPPWMTKAVNGVWWTLPIELLFYVLLPLFVLMQRRIGWLPLLGAGFLLSATWRWGVILAYPGADYAEHQFLLNAFPGSLFSFLAGFCLLGIPKNFARSYRAYLCFALLLVFFGLLLWLRFSLKHYWSGGALLIFWNLLVAPVIAGIVFCLQDNNFFLTRIISSRLLVWLGEISFGIYLWHFPVMQLLEKKIPALLDSPQAGLLALVLSLGASLLLAALSFSGIERPCIRWARAKTSSTLSS